MGEGVLVFDTMFTPGAGRDLRRVAEGVTGKPVRWVVNSHRDYDHYLGNQAFADVVRIGTRATRQVMEQRTPALIELVRTQHASFLEEFRGRIAAETDPILREELTHEYGEHAALAAARDGLVPVYPSALRYGVPEKWAAFLVELLALDFRWVVPGHGPPRLPPRRGAHGPVCAGDPGVGRGEQAGAGALPQLESGRRAGGQP